jgi:hypothetical protein
MTLALLSCQLMNVLAEVGPRGALDDGPRQSSNNGLSFSDLQKGFRDRLDGHTDDTHYSRLLWAIVIAIVLLGIFLHLRQRRKEGGPPTSDSALFREITRGVAFPFATKWLLKWVARTAQIPAPTLLISAEIYQRSVADWSRQPTYALLRQWGASRLAGLEKTLFAEPSIHEK